MAVSEAQKQASKRYQSKLSGISIKLKPEQHKRYKEAAEAAGIPLRAYILEALEEKMQREQTYK